MKPDNILQTVQTISQECMQALNSAKTLDELELVRVKYLGRKGVLADLMKTLKDRPVETKRVLGPQLNQLKQSAQELFNIKKAELEQFAQEQLAQQEQYFDVTAYKTHQARGGLHPYTQTINRIQNIFISMGYEVLDGLEIETDTINFEALNIPSDHPARDMHDTFWLDLPGRLLRTHTSTVQSHTLSEKKPPFAVVSPGRCFRNEATDASHDYMFMQTEGFVVGKNISMSHLLATLKQFLNALFKRDDLNIRLRPGYFPFVEPGVEVDIECPFCTKGCNVCKKTRWIETAGAGLIHPNVLKYAGIDTKKYSGFAFGFGLTRLVMLRYNINDIRLLHSDNMEFLKQFR